MHRSTGLRLLHEHHRFLSNMGSIEGTGLLVGQRQEQLATAMLLVR